MTPFDLTRAVCNTKDLGILEKHEWDDLKMSTYMLNRWVSMTNPHNAKVVNEFTNSIALSRTENPKRVYMMLASVTTPFGKMKYIKKSSKSEGVSVLKKLTPEEQKLELTPRERLMYDDFIDSLTEKEKILDEKSPKNT